VPARPVRLAALSLAGLSALALAACGDTLQVQPIPHNILESLIVAPQPVYWLGGAFAGLPVTEASHDPGGAYTVGYGNCVEGGQATCVPPLRVITSPDNSFLPGGSLAHIVATVRGVPVVIARGGRTIEIPTGAVVVDVYARDARLAAAAARTLVPINAPGVPAGALPQRLPNSAFASTPLPSQVPSPLHQPG
jgi:hypothetical protein